MVKAGAGWTTGVYAPPPSQDAWDAVKAAGISMVRLTVSLTQVFDDPSKINWSEVDVNIQRIYQAGLQIYFNAQWFPSWASEGKPTYVSLIRPIPGTKGTSNPNENIEGTCEWVLDDTGKNTGNIRFAAEREYLIHPGHIAQTFIRMAAFRCRTIYGPYVTWWGVGNEPGGAMFYPPIFGDGVNGGPLGDTIKNWYIPELNNPWWEGLNTPLGRVGPEADGADVLRRILELAPQIQIPSYHPYGPDGSSTVGSIAKCEAEWWPILDRMLNGREEWISEIGDPDSARLLDWTKEILAKRHIGALILPANAFFEPSSWPNSPVLSNVGQQFKQLFAAPPRHRPSRPL